MGLVAGLIEAPQWGVPVQPLPLAAVSAGPFLAGAGLSMDVLGDPLPRVADGPQWLVRAAGHMVEKLAHLGHG